MKFPVDLNLICRKSKLWILKLVGKFNAEFLGNILANSKIRSFFCNKLNSSSEENCFLFCNSNLNPQESLQEIVFYFAKSVVKFSCNKLNSSSEAIFPIFLDLSQDYYLFLMILWQLRSSSSLSFSLFFPPQFTLYWHYLVLFLYMN